MQKKQKQQLHSFRHCNKNKNKNFVQYVQRPNESGAKRKNTITLKLKQVCATLRQQVHAGIAMVYTRRQSHIAAYLNSRGRFTMRQMRQAPRAPTT